MGHRRLPSARGCSDDSDALASGANLYPHYCAQKRVSVRSMGPGGVALRRGVRSVGPDANAKSRHIEALTGIAIMISR